MVIVSGEDFFKEPPPDEKETRSTSMGKSSGTQQVYPPRQGNRATTRNIQGDRGNQFDINNLNMDSLYQPVNFFGTSVPMYGVLAICVIAYMVWGFAGVIAVAVTYWISATFQQAPPQQAPRAAEDASFQPINPPPTNNGSTNSSRFPGAARPLGK